MSTADYYNVLATATKLLDFIGANPMILFKTKRSTVLPSFAVFSLVSLLLLSFVELQRNNFELDTFMKWMDTNVIFLQCLTFQISILVYRKSFVSLLEDIQHFWNIDLTKKDHANLQRRLKFWHTIFVRYNQFALFNIIAILLKPIIGKPRDLPFFSMIPTNNWLYGCLYMYHVLSAVPLYTIIASFNILFAGIIALLSIQFNIVKEAFKGIRPETLNRDLHKKVHAEMKKTIQHHVFLIKYANNTSRVFSSFALSQCGLLVCFVSVKMILGFNKTMDPTVMTATASLIFIAMLEQYFLCYMGELLQETSLSVADGMYESEWYLDHDKHIRYCTLMVIQAAHRPKVISAYGLIEINRNTFIKFYRFSWSIFALFTNLQD